MAEDALNRNGPVGSAYQENTRRPWPACCRTSTTWTPRSRCSTRATPRCRSPAGMFSTADLLSEDRLVEDPGQRIPTINLNHAVQRVIDRGRPGGRRRRLRPAGRRQREYRADTVVLGAGTIESAKIALQSQLDDPADLIGRGITDHPIWYTHFSLPAGSPHAATDASAKLWSRHRDTSVDQHPYNVVVELGADFNQGRYVDPDNLARQPAAEGRLDPRRDRVPVQRAAGGDQPPRAGRSTRPYRFG